MGLATKGIQGIAITAVIALGGGLAGCDAGSKPKSAVSSSTAHEATPEKPRRLNAGMWETVTTVNGRAMPPAPMCITQATADEINGDDASIRRGLAQANAAPGCTISNVTVAGARVDFDTVCDGTTVQTVLTYSGDSYSGTMAVAGAPAMSLTARRVGACPAGQG